MRGGRTRRVFTLDASCRYELCDNDNVNISCRTSFPRDGPRCAAAVRLPIKSVSGVVTTVARARERTAASRRRPRTIGLSVGPRSENAITTRNDARTVGIPSRRAGFVAIEASVRIEVPAGSSRSRASAAIRSYGLNVRTTMSCTAASDSVSVHVETPILPDDRFLCFCVPTFGDE